MCMLEVACRGCLVILTAYSVFQKLCPCKVDRCSLLVTECRLALPSLGSRNSYGFISSSTLLHKTRQTGTRRAISKVVVQQYLVPQTSFSIKNIFLQKNECFIFSHMKPCRIFWLQFSISESFTIFCYIRLHPQHCKSNASAENCVDRCTLELLI